MELQEIYIIAFLILFLFILVLIRLRQQNQQLKQNADSKTKELMALEIEKNNLLKSLNNKNNSTAVISQFYQKIISIISHDLKSPLKYLMITSKSLSLENPNHKSEDFQDNLNLISLTSEQLFNFTSNIISYSKLLLKDHFKSKEKFELFNSLNDNISLLKDHQINATNVEYKSFNQSVNLFCNKMLFDIFIYHLFDYKLDISNPSKIEFEYLNFERKLTITINNNTLQNSMDSVFSTEFKNENNLQYFKKISEQIVENLIEILEIKISYSTNEMQENKWEIFLGNIIE